MNLVIVESPTKARTLSRFLGKDYKIEPTMGHIRDLPKSTLAIDIAHNFAPEYAWVKDKARAISHIKAAAKDADTIILATDPDREGEAIAWHVNELVSSKKKLKRIVFHEITKEAIEEALQNPRGVDTNLVDAQTARRVLDRLVGYKLSPLLWKKVRRGLSAGRVQSVALRLIVEREREIEKFSKEPYFTVEAVLVKHVIPAKAGIQKSSGFPVKPGMTNEIATSSRQGETPRNDNLVTFELFEINGEKIEIKEKLDLYDGEYTFAKTTIDVKDKADAIVSSLVGKPFVVADISQKETRRSPYPPFTTSTLQQEASRRLGFTSKRTMSVAQKLYEEGFITYHRTDSVAMATTAVFSIRNFIEKEYGQKYVNSSPRMYKTKQKLAQEAHEAIRPTAIQNSESRIQNELGPEYARLYGLIWKRAVATQMSDAVLESTTVYADVVMGSTPLGGEPLKDSYRFKTTGSVIVFDGFLKLYLQALNEQKLPVYLQGDTLEPQKIDAVSHETTPPPRYNEASLIATLEEKGIGRPSTYAPIISTIEERRYVEKDPPTGGGRFAPTAVGMVVNDFLVENFSDIDDIPFTVAMEDQLDEVATGKRNWVAMMREFYTPFEKKLVAVEAAARVQIPTEETEEKCPTCGSNLIIREGRFGKFLACSTFPKCRFTKSFVEETDVICPKDGGKVVVKKTKRGRRFYGCSNYPKCDFAVWKLEDIKKPS